MRRDITYMFAMSLDGFIARNDGGIDWLDNYPPNSDFDFDTFMDSVTGIVMGRDTYDVVVRLEHWPYERYPTVIATRRAIDDLPKNAVVSSRGWQKRSLSGRIGRPSHKMGD